MQSEPEGAPTAALPAASRHKRQQCIKLTLDLMKHKGLWLVAGIAALWLYTMLGWVPLFGHPDSAVNAKSNFPEVIGHPDAREAADGDGPSCTVVVLTMNRVASLRRLLQSLENADYAGDTVHLHIKVDNSRDNGNVIFLANAFAFSHGKKTVTVAPENRGLRQAWFDAWTPSNDNDCGIIIEDDVEMSVRWFVWLKAAWRNYRHRDDLAGISLCRQVLIPQKPTRQSEIVNGHKPFLYSLLGSNGFSPHPKQWLKFIHWIKSIDLNTFDVSTPGLITSDWWRALPKRGMWTQHFIYFTKKHSLYTLYVNLPNRETMAAHWREKGEHFARTEGRDFNLATTVPMEFPKQLNKYDFSGKQVE